MTKRRYISQLPVIHQTQTLQKFFNATVDQAFQPGDSQNINALVGRKPTYFDPLRDFYKREINKQREFYQLEPSMTAQSVDNTQFSDLLFYQDLVNNLKFKGALTDNHERLFSNDFYSWCPPIDVHKLTNFADYYWLPDGPPITVLNIPFHTYTATNEVGEFQIPIAVPNSVIDVVVHVDNQPIVDFSVLGNQVKLTNLKVGSQVKVWSCGNFLKNLKGTTYSYPLPCEVYAKQTQFIEYTTNRQLITFPQYTLDTPGEFEIDMIIELKDNQGTQQYQVTRNALGSLVLVKPRFLRFQKKPLHTLIARNAKSASSWSATNHWYHKSLLIYDNINYSPVKATRPIIEFLNSIELQDYPKNGRVLPDVQGFIPATSNVLAYNNSRLYAVYSQDSTKNVSFGISNVLLKLTESMVTGRWIISNGINKNQILELDTVRSEFQTYFDTHSQTYKNDSLVNSQYGADNLIIDIDGKYSSKIGVQTIYDSEVWGWDWGVDLQFSAIRPTATKINDIVHNTGNNQELFFDSSKWSDKIQQYQSPYEPLFSVYGKQGEYLNASTKIFSFTKGQGINDAFLEFPLSRNAFGSIEFSDHMTDSLPENLSQGFKFYKIAEKFGNSWNDAGKSQQTITNGLYTIPSNLQANPLNQNITTISTNNWNDQFKEILKQNPKSWLKYSDQMQLSVGKRILQHRSPLLLTMLLNSGSTIDCTNSILYNEREYLRYRGKFSQLLNTMSHQYDLGNIDPLIMLDKIMVQLKSAKTKDFPFSNNGVAGGDWFIPATPAYLGITAVWEPQYSIDTTLAGVQVLYIRGHDGSLTAAITRGDNDNPIVLPQDNISGNLDPRDVITFAFEQLIYQSTHISFREVATLNPSSFNLNQVNSGNFRSGQYSNDEFKKVQQPIFERWVATSGLNYRENKIYNSENPFTWNYGEMVDISGNRVPGYWRGIYHWYFDTDRPHQAPWEMLGYNRIPNWWAGYYPGDKTAPARDWGVTGKRSALLLALETGLISEPGKPSVRNPLLARPGVSKILPVNKLGELLDPIACGIMIDSGIVPLDSNWEFGDKAPVENSWFTSFNHSFMLTQMGFLLKPARFVEGSWCTINDQGVVNKQSAHNQWINAATGDRSVKLNTPVHNESREDGTFAQVLGLQTMISDYIKSQGLNVGDVLGKRVRTLGVNLAHKLGGFTDQTQIRTFTENKGLIPPEDVLTALYRSPSIREEFYGGVITEKTDKGWRVIGYDVLDPNFKVLPVQLTGEHIPLNLVEKINNGVDWRTNTYYQVGVLVFSDGKTYKCVKTHTSSTVFEGTFWTLTSMTGRSNTVPVFWYLNHEPEVMRVPYGTEFYSQQQVSDFMSGYQAYLKTRGWHFDQYDIETNQTKDFKYSTLEFMYWSQTKWEDGSFIALSPSANSVKFTCTHGSIQNVEQLVNGAYSVLDRSGAAIKSSTVTSNRLDDEITVGTTVGGIFGLRLFISEIEQAMVFKNRTIFNDVIYEPLFDLRQERIRIIASISTNWVGRLDAPGFIITGNNLIPSFDKQVEDIRYTYDIEKSSNPLLRDSARSQIGYQGRPYLEPLMFNEVNQFEFYQGMIQQKGALGVFTKLLRNSELTQTRNLTFLEEWAFRTSVYGGNQRQQIFEFKLFGESIKTDPQLVEINDISPWDYFSWDSRPHQWEFANAEEMAVLDSQEDKVITLSVDSNHADSRWVSPPNSKNLFSSSNDYTKSRGDLPNAGYVRLDETDFQALTWSQLNTRIRASTSEPQTNQRIWVYDILPKRTWNVFHTTAIGVQNSVKEFINTGNGLKIIMSSIVLAEVGDYVYISKSINQQADISGFYPIVELSGNSLVIEVITDSDHQYDDTEEKPTVLRLLSTRLRINDSTNQLLLNKQIKVMPCVNPLVANNQFKLMGNYNFSTSSGNQSSGSTPCLIMAPTGGFKNGYLIYVDVCYELEYQNLLETTRSRWAAYTYDKAKNLFVLHRTQPRKILSSEIKDVKLFDTNSTRTRTELNSKPLINSDIVLWDPIQGLVPGAAQAEIWYKLDYDPANYNTGDTSDYSHGLDWGQQEVGRLWWDLSTTRFMQTDTNGDLDRIELQYRQNQWGKLAPGASIDVYEWVKSAKTPVMWNENYKNSIEYDTYDGPVLNPENMNYVESTEFDIRLGTYVPVYFFWVLNRKNIPIVPFRKMSCESVSQMLANPTSQVAWVAAISPQHFIIGNSAKYLSSSSSIQFKINTDTVDTAQHIEWKIIKNGDERSVPDATLWTKLTQSLTAKTSFNQSVPSKERFSSDLVGYDVENGQNLFKDVKAARKHTVGFINQLLKKFAIIDERRPGEVLNTTEQDSPYMQWSQTKGSYYIKPIPAEKYWAPNKSNKIMPAAALSYENTAQLVFDIRPNNAFWNVLDYEQSTGKIVSVETHDITFATVQDLPQYSYDLVGVKMKVIDTQNSGFWSIWEALPGMTELTLMQMQRYYSQAGESWKHSDWYADSYDASQEPTVSFTTARDRDVAMADNPYATLVKINNSGKGNWIWTQYIDDQWITVAKQNATIQLSDSIWENTGNTFDFSGLTVAQILKLPVSNLVKNRDMGFELDFILNSLRENILTGLELNQLFFSWIKYAHTEQDFIDWCFKTSFMSITGYSDKLRQDPLTTNDLTQNLLEYVNEVKPYHVKVRDFISKYQAGSEMANVQVRDFDMSSFVDLKNGTIRTLNPDVAADQLILSQGRYVGWYDKWFPLYTRLKEIRALVPHSLDYVNATRNLTENVVKSPIRRIKISRKNYVSQDNLIFANSVLATETVDVNIRRLNVPDLDYNAYDVGIPIFYPVDDATKLIDFSQLRHQVNPEYFMETALNWDNVPFDDDASAKLDDYHQRSLIVEPSNQYSGAVCASLFDNIESTFWDNKLRQVSWDTVNYLVSTNDVEWLDTLIVSNLGYGLQLTNPRMLSLRVSDGASTTNHQILHVVPDSNTTYRLRIVNDTVTQRLGNINQWITTSTAAPVDHPI